MRLELKKENEKKGRTQWIGIAILSIVLIIFLCILFYTTDVIGTFCEEHLGACHRSVTDANSLFSILRLKEYSWVKYVILLIPITSFLLSFINVVRFNKRKQKVEKC